MNSYINSNLLKRLTSVFSGPEKQTAYRVQGNLTLHSIEYPLYVLDSSDVTVLTLPTSTEMELAQGTIITLLNPIKNSFIISGNDINIVRAGTQSQTITLSEYQSIKLILLDIGSIHDALWYEVIAVPAAGTLTSEQLNYIVSQVPVTNISGLQPKETGKGLYPDADSLKLAGIATNATNYSHPANHAPSIITQDASNRFVTDTEKSTWNGKGSSNLVLGDLVANAYPGDKGKTAYDHSQVAHAPAGAEVNVNADWNSGSGDSQILNKPSIPAAQVQTDWNAGSGMGQLLNKPTVPNIRLFTNLVAPVVTSGATEKVLLQLAIPAARAIVGSTFRAWVVGNSSSTGTLIFRIKCGPNGSISDTEDWKSVTSAAQVANARAGFECLITIRSATTIAVDGVGYAGAVQLPTTIAVPATPAIVISGIWYINMTVVCSSGTFTAQVGSVEEIR